MPETGFILPMDEIARLLTELAVAGMWERPERATTAKTVEYDPLVQAVKVEWEGDSPEGQMFEARTLQYMLEQAWKAGILAFTNLDVPKQARIVGLRHHPVLNWFVIVMEHSSFIPDERAPGLQLGANL